MRGFEIKIDCSELGLGGFVVNELKTGKGQRSKDSISVDTVQ